MKNRGIKLAKKALQTKPRRFSVIWMLPNFLTICALIFGLQAMYMRTSSCCSARNLAAFGWSPSLGGSTTIVAGDVQVSVGKIFSTAP